MKKLLFTAMACVAFAFNGLASNEVVYGNTPIENFYKFSNYETNVDYEENIVYKYTCNVHVVSYDAFGNQIITTYTQTYYFVTEFEGSLKCTAYEANIRNQSFNPR